MSAFSVLLSLLVSLLLPMLLFLLSPLCSPSLLVILYLAIFWDSVQQASEDVAGRPEVEVASHNTSSSPSPFVRIEGSHKGILGREGGRRWIYWEGKARRESWALERAVTGLILFV